MIIVLAIVTLCKKVLKNKITIFRFYCMETNTRNTGHISYLLSTEVVEKYIVDILACIIRYNGRYLAREYTLMRSP